MTNPTKLRIQTLAVEEASIYDVLIELREEFGADTSFDALIKSFQDTMQQIKALYDEGGISFYDSLNSEIGLDAAEANIYSSFLRRTKPGRAPEGAPPR